jgi:hypothetical protein
MKTQIINSTNYEAYYLDFLEGNLSEDMTAQLMAFLAQNPDLVVDEEMIYLLDFQDNKIVFPDVKSLKVPDLEREINTQSVENFMIAAVENELETKKQAELTAFIQQNPQLERDFELFRQSKLKADVRIVFPAKNKIKRGKLIPMFGPFASIAAGLVLYISFNLLQGGNESIVDSSAALKTSFARSIRVPSQKSNHVEVSSQEATTYFAQNNNQTLSSSKNKKNIENSNSIPLSYLPIKKADLFSNKPLMLEPILANTQDITKKYYTQQEVLVGVDQMKNPIVPVTNKLAEVFQQDIDFRTSRAAKKQKGGFYLKIGKFEISRKVYDFEYVADK